MAKVECYRPDGTMVMKEPVDARECVEHCGFTMEPVETGKIPEEKKLDKMNKTELIEKATALEIKLDGSETKQDLLDLIEIAEQE
jgi:Zn ribbon nucleic-acid-binding protein